MNRIVFPLLFLIKQTINFVLFEFVEPGEYANQLYGELKGLFPEHLPVQTAMLTSLDSPEARRHVPHDDLTESAITLANQIMAVADVVITSIDQDKLLAYYGLKSDQRSDAAKIKTSMEKQKNSLIEALVKKGCALSRLYIHGKNDKTEGDGPHEHLLDSVSNLWKEVLKFAEPTDSKVKINRKIFSFSPPVEISYVVFITGYNTVPLARSYQSTLWSLLEVINSILRGETCQRSR